MLVLKDVKKAYHAKSGVVGALNGIDLELPATGMVFITGKSGCGKTTLLNVIGGLDGIDSGDISVMGKSFSAFTAEDYDNYRNTFIGFIFQEYNLLSEYTVEKNIELAMELQGSTVNQEKLDALLETVDILPLKNRKPNELSGGQRQRVAIARALVKEPRIIMADEPTGALDSATGEQVLDILKKLAKDKLIIVVSHDAEFAERYADRLIRLVDGKVVEDTLINEKELTSNVSETETSLLVKDGSTLTEYEKDTLAKAIKERKKIEIIQKLAFREKHPIGKVETVTQKDVKFVKSKMKFKSALSMGVKSLGVKPLRLLFTIFLSAIAFAVFGLFDTIANFSTEKVINSQLRNSISSSIVVNGEYVVDYQNGDKYGVRLDEDFRKELENQTNDCVKGVFDYGDVSYGTFSNTIFEAPDSGVSIGKNYYSTSFTGLIEFGLDEIAPNGKFNRFNYRLVAGKYPTIDRSEIQKLGDNYNYEVAISTYIAESILHYLNGTQLSDAEGKLFSISTIDELINKLITVKGNQYKIVGIIDCGEIPEKYDVLKDTISTSIDTRSLADAFSTFISSSAYKYLFVGEGYLNDLRTMDKDAVLYYSGDTSWLVKAGELYNNAESYLYSSETYGQNNIFLFSNEYEENDKVTLKDDEVLIHIKNLDTLYGWTRQGKLNRLSLVHILNDIQDPTNTIEVKREKFEDLLNKYGTGDSRERLITVSKKSNSTEITISKKVKIVGVYYEVDDRGILDSTYCFMMNKALMNEFKVYTNQGEYTKLLIQPSGMNSTKIIARYMSQKDGLAFNWYGNSALKIITDNEQPIRQSADLFLYASIVLACFSIFMFFNYIVTSIVNKRQSVGVLRCLGSNGKNILLIFTIESVIIAIINGLLATAFTAIGCYFVNLYIMNIMNIHIAFAIFSIRQFIIIMSVSIITAILSSLFPILNISREKPVDLVRKP